MKAEPIQRTHTDFGNESKNTKNAERVLNICERIYSQSNNLPTVLDLGCGAGHIVIQAARRGWKAIGIEPDFETLEIGKRQAISENLKIQFLLGSSDKLEFIENKSVDIVILKDVIEHIPNYLYVLKQSRRILRNGGIIYIATTNKSCPFNLEVAYVPLYSYYPKAIKRLLMRFIMRYCRSLVHYTNYPAINWFTRNSLRRDLINSGFNDVLDIYDFYLEKGDLPKRTQRIFPLLTIGKRVRYLRIFIDFALVPTFIIGKIH